MLSPRVTDISHHNTVTDLKATAMAGVWAVIHKATQGTSYRDPTYAQRRGPANEAGMLWGAYHFGDNSDPIKQVDAFLAYAQPDDSTCLSLDYEDHPNGPGRTMKPQQMVTFLKEIERRTGRKALLYGGNRIKEDIGRLSAADRDYVTSHRLWLCQYGSTPKLPMGFDRSYLWQYTDGAVGPQPHGVPGIKGLVDLNAFNGSKEDLESTWVGPIAAPSEDTPVAEADNTDVSARRRGDDDTDVTFGNGGYVPPRGTVDDPSDLPPFMQAAPPRQRVATGGRVLNVQPVRARYNVQVEVIQRELDAMGYHEVGDIDGLWGGKTAGAIRAFFNDRGVNDRAEMGDLLNAEIAQARADRWTRPIAPARANATPKDIAPKVESVKLSLWGRFSAKVAAGAAALGLGGSGLSDTFTSVKDKLSPVMDGFNAVPGTVWFILVLVVSGVVWYVTDRAAKSTTKDYNTGRLN